MKKYLHYAIIMLFSVPASGWNVETAQSNKSIVIEEFTGIHCGNCPDGHKRATMLHHAHPDDIYIVAVHSGYFATPSHNEPDFVTECGTEIHDYFEIDSYPCATINRRDAGYGVVQGRNNWGASSRQIVSEFSPVNLWIDCTYEADSRTLNVEVEGYYTGEMTDPRLTVEILQDNILGPQSGGLMGDEYPHRHMLRAMLNEDAFGDRLAFSGVGTYFSKKYTTALPSDIKNVTLVDSDIQLLAFVAEGKGEIMKAAKCFPQLNPDNVERNIFVQSDPLIPIEKNYGLGYLEVFIDNYSHKELKEASFEVKLNGYRDETFWTGSIPPHCEQLIQVPLPSGWTAITDNDDNEVSIKMITANGEYPVLETLPLKCKFTKVSEFPSDLTIRITTDIEALDNIFRIIDQEGNTIAQFGPYNDGVASTYEEKVKLDEGKVYGFEVSDSWGNGIFHPRGSVKFYGPDDKICGQLMEINNFGTRVFFRTTDTADVELIDAKDVVTTEYYDLTGRKLNEPASGITIIVPHTPDGESSVSKSVKY